MTDTLVRPDSVEPEGRLTEHSRKLAQSREARALEIIRAIRLARQRDAAMRALRSHQVNQ